MRKLHYKLLIVDDMPDSLSYIRLSLDELAFIHKEIAIISNPMEALQYMRNHEVDILLLDMDLNLADLTGVKFAGMIPNPPVIIACSAHTNYVFEANEAGIYSYISKTTSFDKLKTKMEDAITQVDKRIEMQNRNIRVLKIPIEKGQFVDLEVDQIYYAELLPDGLKVYMGQDEYVFRLNLREFQAKLPADQFARPRNNTLVNLAKVGLIRTDLVYLTKPRENIQLSITPTFKSEFNHQHALYRQNNK
ncbi:hypothetical protein BCY89_00065 [Sphingobacterium siyangense]|uniref:LytTR family two component transcriptional regulator n=1 Tax=Sphingobacterium siyangense TaxID=459529 RepID=A0A420G9U8_9SPHI|nr:LytTR family DNA-binding domain-containing protein [Sphingobacterium siyangense]RKF41948.1 hypothetical protein BCY89_00065 [Sphingobacterium siyangense]